MDESTGGVRGFVRRYGLLIALLLLAAFFYAIGFRRGSTIALMLGVLVEILFWVKLLRR